MKCLNLWSYFKIQRWRNSGSKGWSRIVEGVPRLLMIDQYPFRSVSTVLFAGSLWAMCFTITIAHQRTRYRVCPPAWVQARIQDCVETRRRWSRCKIRRRWSDAGGVVETSVTDGTVIVHDDTVLAHVTDLRDLIPPARPRGRWVHYRSRTLTKPRAAWPNSSLIFWLYL